MARSLMLNLITCTTSPHLRLIIVEPCLSCKVVDTFMSVSPTTAIFIRSAKIFRNISRINPEKRQVKRGDDAQIVANRQENVEGIAFPFPSFSQNNYENMKKICRQYEKFRCHHLAD